MRWAVLGATLASLCLTAAAGAADVRVTPDNRPGSYQRLDGTVDATHEACATRRRSQQEPAVAVNPRNPRIVAVGAMDTCHAFRPPVGIPQPYNWLGLYRSSDGGRTFDASLFPGYPGDLSALALSGECSLQADATMSFDTEGRLFVGGICFRGGAAGVPHFHMGVATFDEDGRRLLRVVQSDRHASFEENEAYNSDRPNLVVDQSRGPHAGNVYMAFTECPRPGLPCDVNPGPVRLAVSRSTDHGRSFSSPVVIPSPDGSFVGASDLAVGPDGTLYYVFRTATVDRKRSFWITRSTDGGRSFSRPERLAEVSVFANGVFGGMCGDGPFECETGFNVPVFNDLIAVTADATGVHVAFSGRTAEGQARVFVRNSPDGVDWSERERPVSDRSSGHQWWPDMVSADGTISLIFLDSRADRAYAPDLPPGNTREGTSSGPAVDTFLAQSVDGGRTWRERRLTNVSSEPNLETYVDARVSWRGDYIYLSAVPGGGYAVWVDSRDVVKGRDSRADNADEGFDVHAPCNWSPNTVEPNPVPTNPIPPTDAYASPSSYADPCLSQGGLDQNVYGTSFSALPARGCLSRYSPIGPRNIGPIRLGYTRRRLLRLPVKPLRRTDRSYRYCVKRSDGRVSAVFSGRGRVVLVASTARGHGSRGVRPGRRSRAMRVYPRRRQVARGLYRAGPRSRHVIGVRRGRVRFVAVADRRLLRNHRTLRRHLRAAGL